MTTFSKLTGRLENVRAQNLGMGCILWGNIYGDSYERFFDGAYIHTSGVKRLDGNIVYTHNSIYEISSWASPEDETAARKYVKVDSGDEIVSPMNYPATLGME